MKKKQYNIPEVSNLPLIPVRLKKNPSADAVDFHSRVFNMRRADSNVINTLWLALSGNRTDVLTDGKKYYTVFGQHVAELRVDDLLKR